MRLLIPIIKISSISPKRIHQRRLGISSSGAYSRRSLIELDSITIYLNLDEKFSLPHRFCHTWTLLNQGEIHSHVPTGTVAGLEADNIRRVLYRDVRGSGIRLYRASDQKNDTSQ